MLIREPGIAQARTTPAGRGFNSDFNLDFAHPGASITHSLEPGIIKSKPPVEPGAAQKVNHG